MLEWDLVDVKPTSLKYSSKNKRYGINSIEIHLDHFLVHNDWYLEVKQIYLDILPHSDLDHNPKFLQIK